MGILLGESTWVGIDLFLQGRQLLVELLGGEDTVGTGVGLEEAAVHGHLLATEQRQVLAQQDEIPVGGLQRQAVALAEVGEGLVAGPQALDQPDGFQVAQCLALQAAAGVDAVQVAVQVELEQRRRRKRRLPGTGAGGGVSEAEHAKVQRFHIGINGADGVARGNVVVNTRW